MCTALTVRLPFEPRCKCEGNQRVRGQVLPWMTVLRGTGQYDGTADNGPTTGSQKRSLLAEINQLVQIVRRVWIHVHCSQSKIVRTSSVGRLT